MTPTKTRTTYSAEYEFIRPYTDGTVWIDVRTGATDVEQARTWAADARRWVQQRNDIAAIAGDRIPYTGEVRIVKVTTTVTEEVVQ